MNRTKALKKLQENAHLVRNKKLEVMIADDNFDLKLAVKIIRKLKANPFAYKTKARAALIWFIKEDFYCFLHNITLAREYYKAAKNLSKK